MIGSVLLLLAVITFILAILVLTKHVPESVVIFLLALIVLLERVPLGK